MRAAAPSPGQTEYQTIIPTSTMNAGKKSTIGTVTDASGISTRGKYTFVTRPRLETRLALDSATADAKYVHGSERREREDRIRQTPFEGKFANFPKTR